MWLCVRMVCESGGNMSELCYLECQAWIRDAAYDIAKTFHDREPTEEEIDDEIENLMDRCT